MLRAALPAARSTRVEQWWWRAPGTDLTPVLLCRVGSVAGSLLYMRKAGAEARLAQPFTSRFVAARRLFRPSSTRVEQGRWQVSSPAPSPV